MVFIVTIFFVSFLGLLFSAKFSLEKIILLIKLFKKRDYILGILLLGLGTSLPELFVGINSALNQKPEISVSNIIGSNMINLSLIIGIGIMVAGYVHTRNQVFTRESLFSVFSIFLPLSFILFDGKITRLDGTILIVFFLIYYLWLVPKKEINEIITSDINVVAKPQKSKAIFIILEFLIGLFVLFAASDLLIRAGIPILKFLGIPVFILGLFILTIGTTIPELTLNVVSGMKKRPGLALGNLYGTLVSNSCLVLGVVALIYPINFAPNYFIYNAVLYLALAVILFLILARTRNILTRLEGFILILLYVLFMITSFYLSIINQVSL